MAEYIVYIPDHVSGERDPASIQGHIAGELVRCKDCQYYERCELPDLMLDHENGYCSDGERKNEYYR